MNDTGENFSPHRETSEHDTPRLPRKPKDPFRWVGAPPEDQSDNGHFRRQIAELLRQVLNEYGDGGVRAAGAGEGGEGKGEVGDEGLGAAAGEGGGAAEIPRHRFDVREGTVYRALQFGRVLESRVARAAPSLPVLRGAVLLEIARAGVSTPAELRRRLRLSSSTLAANTRRLESEGLIVSSEHAGDRRTVVLRATAEGKSAALALGDAWRAVDERLLARLTQLEVDQLRFLLWKAVGG